MASESDQTDEGRIGMEDLALAVEQKLQHKNFTIQTHSLDYISQRVGVADHASFTITIFNAIKDAEETLGFFVKLFPKDESFATFARVTAAFDKEEFSYRLFEEFEKAGISLIQQCVPKCFAVRPSCHLVLEDLQLGNYAVTDKPQLLNYEQVTAAIQSLAKLHASSLIYEESLTKSLPANGREDMFRDRIFSDSKSLMDSSMNCILTEINLFQLPAGKSTAEAIKQLLSRLPQMVKPSGKFRNVFCHGDVRSTNFLLKPSNPTQCKFVDFQMCRYLPPAHDVMLLLFLNTSREFRKNHLYELIGIYYSYLEKILKIFDYKLGELISFSDFLDSCEEQKVVAVLATALTLPLVLSEGDKLQQYLSDKDLYHGSQLVLDHVANEEVLSRLRESIEDLLECVKVRQLIKTV